MSLPYNYAEYATDTQGNRIIKMASCSTHANALFFTGRPMIESMKPAFSGPDICSLALMLTRIGNDPEAMLVELVIDDGEDCTTEKMTLDQIMAKEDFFELVTRSFDLLEQGQLKIHGSGASFNDVL